MRLNNWIIGFLLLSGIAQGQTQVNTGDIANLAVTNAKSALMNNSTVKCNISGGSASPSDCTISQIAGALSVNGALLGANNLSDVANPTTSRNNISALSAALNNGSIFVGTAANAAASVPMTGDITIVSSGATTVAKVQGTTVSGTTGTTNVVFSSGPTLANPIVGTQATSDNSTKAASTAFVQTALNQLNPAAAVVAASTANIAGTYTNAVGGVCIGDTFQVTSTSAFSPDGVTLTVGQRFLMKDQSSTFQDGVWTLTTAANIGVLGALLTRATDSDSAADLNAGQIVPVSGGTVNAGSSWYQTAAITTCNSDAQTWTNFQKASSAYLQSANNLSDLGNGSTAILHLGFPNIPYGNILFGSSSTIPSTDSNLYWDVVNHRLGLRRIPSNLLDIYNSTDDVFLGSLNLIGQANNANATWALYANANNLQFFNKGLNSNSFVLNYLGEVGIGAPTMRSPDAQLLIRNNANLIAGGATATAAPTLVVQQMAGQTGLPFQTQDSNGNVQYSIDVNGNSSTQSISVGGYSTYGGMLVNNGTKFTGSIISAPVCAAVSASQIDWSQGNCFTKTLAANTVLTFLNAQPGQTILARITNTSSNFTLTFPNTRGAGTSVLWPGSTVPILSVGQHSDLFTIFFDGTNYYGATPTQNY